MQTEAERLTHVEDIFHGRKTYWLLERLNHVLPEALTGHDVGGGEVDRRPLHVRDRFDQFDLAALIAAIGGMDLKNR